MTTKTFMATKITQNNDTRKFIAFKSKDFLRACQTIQNTTFDEYDIEEDWFGLFWDKNNTYWSVMWHNRKYYLAIDGIPMIPIGKLQNYIYEFIDNEKAEAEKEARELREEREYRQELFRNYGVGRI